MLTIAELIHYLGKETFESLEIDILESAAYFAKSQIWIKLKKIGIFHETLKKIS